MPQFDVYRRSDGYLLDCQADALSYLSTRLVVPLTPIDEAPPRHPRLTPIFQIAGRELVMVTQFASAVTLAELGTMVGSLTE